MNLIIKIWELFCVYHLGQVQNDNLHWSFEQRWWTGFGRTVLTNHLCCAHPWKLKVSWRIILVSSQPVSSNLNHRTGPRRLETRSGNGISCVPNTCHCSVLAARPEKLSKTATVTGHLSAPRNTMGQLPKLGFFSLKLPLQQGSQAKPERVTVTFPWLWPQ